MRIDTVLRKITATTQGEAACGERHAWRPSAGVWCL